MAGVFAHNIDFPASPCVSGRVDIAEGPFVSRNLPIRMHVPFAKKQYELFLGEVGIERREGNHVECEVPSRIPRVLPFVGHGNDVPIEKVIPTSVASLKSGCRGSGNVGVAFEPVVNGVVVELLGPQQSRVGLTLQGSFFFVESGTERLVPESVGLANCFFESRFKRIAKNLVRRFVLVEESQIYGNRFARIDRNVIANHGHGASAFGSNGVIVALYDPPMEGIFRVRRIVRLLIQCLGTCLVFS